jgi:hypothetical protein
MAKLCDQYELNPERDIVGHYFLDPKRKTDPVTGLAHSRRSYEQLLRDVLADVKVFKGGNGVVNADTIAAKNMITVGRVNVREKNPSTLSPVTRQLNKGIVVRVVGSVTNGQAINGNSVWFKTDLSEWIWSGGLVEQG